MQKKINSLSILFPVYKDSKTVELMISKSLSLIENKNYDYEIIIVNDCCPENSGLIAEKLSMSNKNIRVINHDKNLGYGQALRTGFESCTKDWILQTDGDNQYDLFDFENMIKIIHNYDCIITFRYKKIYQSYRIFISWFYNKIVQYLFRSEFRDISTGLRLINREALKSINLTSTSSFIGAEIAIRLMLKGYQVGEMGITTYPRKFGSSSIITLKSIFKTFVDMLKVRKNIFS